MADINEIKGVILNTLGTVAGKTRDFAEKAADKAKDVARVAKLNMELSAEKDTIEKAYLEIGRLYYETRKSSPDGFFVQLCDEITLANENIARILSELEALKTGLGAKGGGVEVEFTEVSADEEKAGGEGATEEDFVKDAPSAEEASGTAEES
ncbi:MAG: hypothetical protein LBL15_01545 [Oscillospiraceae bacterium]|jgi:hypothetical protein|nr:hypothetical protein [Oscillospiraceae bacterium]